MNAPDTTTDLRAKAMLLEKILNAHYGAPFAFFSQRDPVSEMVKTLLSHRTKNPVTKVAYNTLVERFPTWQQVIDSPTAAVEDAVKLVTYPEVKAPRIQNALQTVKDWGEGELTLDYLEDMDVPAARKRLAEIPGVGAKSTAAILNFSRLQMPALVVDMHHLRVAARLGIVPAKATLEKGAKILQSYLPADYNGQQVFDNHQGFMRHGQKVCHWRGPNCGACVVRDHCDYFQKKNSNPAAV